MDAPGFEVIDRVGKPPLRRDRVEGLGDPRQRRGLDQLTRLQFVADNDRRQHRQADIFTREHAHHRHVVHFAQDLQPQRQTHRQGVERGPHAALA